MDILEKKQGARVGTPSNVQVKVHVAIAEQGKLHALQAQHPKAMQYYKHAMQMALQAEDDPQYVNHYLGCLLESLEHTGKYADIIAYCDKMIERGQLIASKDFELESLSMLYLRKGIILLKAGQLEEGLSALDAAIETRSGKGPELAQTLLFMHNSGLKLNMERIEAEQQRTGYFMVEAGQVKAEIAMALPDESLV